MARTHVPDPDALSPRTKPQQRRAIERRQAILDATLALLETHGIDTLSTTLIASRAGVPVASVYGYFPNKMAIIAALMRAAMAEVDASLETLLPIRSDRAAIEAAIDRAIDTIIAGYRASPARQRLFSAVRGNTALEPVARESDQRMTEALTQAVATLRPDLPPARARAVAETLVRTFTALQEGVVTCADPALFVALVAEWRALVKRYVLPLVEK
jgi:AcrR family transcriptional regulator